MNRKLVFFFLIATLVVLTANLMGNWWSNRDNNLFNNGRWIIGKDTGKYLFYTYQFMFDPLKQKKVKLNSRMGFQELLYHEAETDDKRLKKLTFDMVVGGGTYIWVLLRKEGQRAFACRFSYRKNYPSGFFTFNHQGEMVEHIPFPNGMPAIERSTKQTVELELIEDQWIVKIDGQPIGSAPDPEFKNGHFGFRGSGVLRQRNTIESVHIEWLNAGRLITEHENFEAPATTQTQWLFILLCALLIVALRLLRSWGISRCLPAPGATRYIGIDFLLAPLLLGIITQTSELPEIAQLGLSFLLLEICSFAAFAWLVRKHGLNDRIPRIGLVAFIVVTCILAPLSLYRQGDWAGRRQYPPATATAESYPNAFIQYPDPTPSLTEIVKTEPFNVSYGQPFTTGDMAFNQQEISIDFIMPSNTTFDISFQQQSFFTRGDAEGEPLPLQRRLIRLSTVDHVVSGVATQTGRQPEPFVPLQGNLLIGQSNTMGIRSTDQGLVITLNKQETSLIDTITPIGYGETVLMTYEQPVPIQRLEIHATYNQTAKRHFWPILGLLGFPLIVLTGGLLFSLLGGTTLTLSCTGAVATTFPMLSYLAAILFIDPIRLSLMPVDRLTFLDFALAASAWSMLYWIPLHLKRIKHSAILANLFLVVFISCVTFLIWDIFLPPEHLLKTHFAATHSKPGELVNSDQMKVPWYANNQRIGSNIFVWKQQFEGRWIPLDKGPGNMRAFVLGGSQAWGSGAKSTRDTFSGLLSQRCREEGWPAEVINAGVNGAGVSTVRDVFFGVLLHYNPDIVIMDIGLNDTADLNGRANIKERLALFKEIAQACSNQDIDLILVQEPMSTESPYRPHDSLYAGYADIAREFGFQVVDARPALAQADPVEITWWDAAHLSPRGHIIMADTIFPALKKAIEKRLAQP
ncbi:MAG: SGNH/GDSL hydrolase family protein [Desulfobulbaceae bacterium]|nr:SGNH/GDSL hydrolase family protein [Desulfobulbaceae bacterium]